MKGTWLCRSHCDRLQLLDAARPFDMSVADDRSPAPTPTSVQTPFRSSTTATAGNCSSIRLSTGRILVAKSCPPKYPRSGATGFSANSRLRFFLGDLFFCDFRNQVEKERKAELDVTPFMDNLTEVIPACKLQLGPFLFFLKLDSFIQDSLTMCWPHIGIRLSESSRLFRFSNFFALSLPAPISA